MDTILASTTISQAAQIVPQQMDYLDIINKAVVVVGLPSIIVACIYIGRKLQILESLGKTMETAKHNLKVICDKMIIVSVIEPNELKNYSPLALTEGGSKFLEGLGFPNVFEDHGEDFLNFIESEHPKLKYDVELSAIKSIYVLADKDYMNFLKVFFYNNPARNMDNTAPTLGVYVRDKYLEKHPEITQ